MQAMSIDDLNNASIPLPALGGAKATAAAATGSRGGGEEEQGFGFGGPPLLGSHHRHSSTHHQHHPSTNHHGENRGGRGRGSVVRFSVATEIFNVFSMEDYLPEEIRATWYSGGEYKAMKKECRATLRAYALINTAERGAELSSRLRDSICLRGLEHLVSPRVLGERSALKNAVIEAVLAEQDRQEDALRWGQTTRPTMRTAGSSFAFAAASAFDDQEKLREVSEGISLAARERAAAAGTEDARTELLERTRLAQQYLGRAYETRRLARRGGDEGGRGEEGPQPQPQPQQWPEQEALRGIASASDRPAQEAQQDAAAPPLVGQSSSSPPRKKKDGSSATKRESPKSRRRSSTKSSGGRSGSGSNKSRKSSSTAAATMRTTTTTNTMNMRRSSSSTELARDIQRRTALRSSRRALSSSEIEAPSVISKEGEGESGAPLPTVQPAAVHVDGGQRRCENNSKGAVITAAAAAGGGSLPPSDLAEDTMPARSNGWGNIIGTIFGNGGRGGGGGGSSPPLHERRAT